LLRQDQEKPIPAPRTVNPATIWIAFSRAAPDEGKARATAPLQGFMPDGQVALSLPPALKRRCSGSTAGSANAVHRQAQRD